MSKSPKLAAADSDDDLRWRASQNREILDNDNFVYAVKTTGVYCSPDAAARLPKRENVVFFDSAEDAEAAGYRPSRHAATNVQATVEQRTVVVADACRAIDNVPEHLSLDVLAERAGLSPFHFHRVFKAETGLTPKAYANGSRARRIREELARPISITEVIYGAGFNSNSRFYEASAGILGMCPRDYRDGGQNSVIRFAVGQCSLGAILVAQSQKGICAVLLGDDPDALVKDFQDRFRKAVVIGGDADFELLVAQVVGLIEAPGVGLNLPLDLRGTAFQERVWQALRDIPPGTTVSYAQIAERIGSPKAVRAVARACAANHIAVAIPCHRVVRSDGGLSGYRWGIDRKRALLTREAQSVR